MTMHTNFSIEAVANAVTSSGSTRTQEQQQNEVCVSHTNTNEVCVSHPDTAPKPEESPKTPKWEYQTLNQDLSSLTADDSASEEDDELLASELAFGEPLVFLGVLKHRPTG